MPVKGGPRSSSVVGLLCNVLLRGGEWLVARMGLVGGMPVRGVGSEASDSPSLVGGGEVAAVWKNVWAFGGRGRGVSGW